MEVNLRPILTILFLLSLCGAEKVVITRNKNYNPPPLPQSNIKINLVSSKGIETKSPQMLKTTHFFKEFGLPRPKLGARMQNLRILVLRAEFVEDNDSLTTGNGKMDLKGFGSPSDGLFYDPPHTKKYFERQMDFLRNYYRANSFGHCNITYTVKPDRPTECYQLPHKMAYYSGYDHFDPRTGFVYFNTYAMEMGMVRLVADAIAAADQDETVDFSDYDAIIVFHAGTMLQTSVNFLRFRDIPAATIPPGALEYYLGVPYIIANNGTDTIQCPICCLSEMARVDWYMAGALGTTVHEFGHVLGLPDLYDVSGWSNGVGAFDLMGTGGWVGMPDAGVPEGSIPANLGAWTRYFFGHYTNDPVWVEPVVVNHPESLLTLRASAVDTTQFGIAQKTMVKIPISPTEFFLIENRQQDIKQKDTIVIDVEDGVPVYVEHGEFDFFLPGSGILIWHIDDNVIYANYGSNTIQIDPKHKGIDVEEADGIQHFDAYVYFDTLEYYGSKYDLFFVDDSNKSNRKFGSFTNPNSDSYFGKSLLNIEIFSKLDTLMSFSVNFDIYQKGFPVSLPVRKTIHSLNYGDLDGNGDMEIVATTRYGHIYVYNHDGTPYRSAMVDTITTFTAIGDINNDGAEDIVFGSGFNLRVLDGITLTPLTNFPFRTDGIILGAPLLFDINGDNKLEIIFGSEDRKLYCLNSDGTNIANFPIYLNSWIYSTPCVFDETNRTIGVLGADGRFWLINKDGVVKEYTESQHNMLTYSSPVVGDIDRDGKLEAVIVNGYGTFYIYGSDTLEQKFETWIDTVFYYTPALADIDKDGYLEIISPNSSKTLYVFNRNGTIENDFPLNTDAKILYPLVIAELDTISREEIVFGLGPKDSLSSGQLKIIYNRNHEFAFSPLFGDGGFSSPGFVADIDFDGDLELACGSDSGKIYIWDFPGRTASWSGYMNSNKNWGLYRGVYFEISQSSDLIGSFYIYPSPVKGKGTARFFLYQNAEVRVDILDITGHRIGGMKVYDTTPNEYNECYFDFKNQSNGVYILRIEAKNKNKKEVKFKKFAVLK
ncbi:MAG: FG-GAP-like repeat-containing protein [candidate division WOR-3 bacterium]